MKIVLLSALSIASATAALHLRGADLQDVERVDCRSESIMNTGGCYDYCEKFDLGAALTASSIDTDGDGGYSCECVDSDTDETTFACDAEHEKQDVERVDCRSESIMNTGDCAAYCEKFDLGASVVASSVGPNGGGGYSCGCVDSDTDETTFACDAEHEKQDVEWVDCRSESIMNTGGCYDYCEKFDLGAALTASSIDSNGDGGYSCECVDSDTDETTFACDAEHEKQDIERVDCRSESIMNTGDCAAYCEKFDLGSAAVASSIDENGDGGYSCECMDSDTYETTFACDAAHKTVTVDISMI